MISKSHCWDLTFYLQPEAVKLSKTDHLPNQVALSMDGTGASSLYVAITGSQKLWCTRTMKYCSAMRKEDILPFSTTWVELEHIVLSETSQT